MKYTQSQLASTLGRVILFCGTETGAYSPGQWANVALFARQHNIDSVLVKVNDGGNLWYGGANAVINIKNIFLAQGVGFIPYGYFYGNKFGAIDQELAIVHDYLNMFGYFCMDMEVEYNGEVGWSSEVHASLVNHPGILLCSTWADPNLQNWQGNLTQLHDVFDAFMPQEYTNYLDSTESQLSQAGITNMIPTVYLGSDLPGNNVEQIARDIYARGHASISLWYDGFAINNPSTVDNIVQMFHTAQTPTGGNTKYMEEQFNAVWSLGKDHWVGIGISDGVKAAFMDHAISACYPITTEVDTVDWSGNKIKWVSLSNGCHAEYDIKHGHCQLYSAENKAV